MLDYDDPLPHRPRRVAVAGVSGAGKSTLARATAATLGLPYTELDAMFHGPDWTPRPEFLDEVHELVSREAWVTEWQYDQARPILADHADLLVWVDMPFLTVTLPRVIRRTIRRSVRREKLWNDNVEPPLRTIFTDREHIVRWSWARRRFYHSVVPEAETEHPGLVVVRLRSRRQVDRWLAGPLADAAR
ncbi:AAA family ATPase [Demequina sp. NBRC 110054]|uniref:AAA family ATPase n=1 Tax=Demequina sp. NBRC 110054 TaxID=1570343 RepID=UPI0009FD61BE|nr:AAA family ATPase [Demequina sp. NBRC 110054]